MRLPGTPLPFEFYFTANGQIQGGLAPALVGVFRDGVSIGPLTVPDHITEIQEVLDDEGGSTGWYRATLDGSKTTTPGKYRAQYRANVAGDLRDDYCEFEVGYDSADLRAVNGNTTKAAYLEGAIAQAVWTYVSRTLTSTRDETINQLSNGIDIKITAYTQCRIPFSNLGDLTGRSALYFTAKRSTRYGDAHAILQVKEGTGLIRLNGAEPANASWASLVITDEAAGSGYLELEENATSSLDEVRPLEFDLKMIRGGASTLVRRATAYVTQPVTQATT